MEFNPPVSERQTKELLNIISNDEKWSEEIQILAEEELYRRNFTWQAIKQEKQKRINILKKLDDRKTEQFEKNRTESYTIAEMIGITIFFPFFFFIQFNPLTEFWNLDAGNYKKKIWQRGILILISLFLWFQLLRLTN
ncbi:MAG: hypothetical protein JST62_09730 [Bacteroidetes bacterium]|nr:hypothetical protein [Bacteroidota bacterium]